MTDQMIVKQEVPNSDFNMKLPTPISHLDIETYQGPVQQV